MTKIRDLFILSIKNNNDLLSSNIFINANNGLMTIKKRFFDSIMPFYIEDRITLENLILEQLVSEMTLPQLLKKVNGVNDCDVDLHKVRQTTLGLLHLGFVTVNTENLLCPKYKANENGRTTKLTDTSKRIKNYKTDWNLGLT